jgi:hypothetical protein
MAGNVSDLRGLSAQQRAEQQQIQMFQQQMDAQRDQQAVQVKVIAMDFAVRSLGAGGQFPGTGEFLEAAREIHAWLTGTEQVNIPVVFPHADRIEELRGGA